METKIFACYGCEKKLRLPADRKIVFSCPACGQKYYSEYGIVKLYETYTKEHTQKETKQKRRNDVFADSYIKESLTNTEFGEGLVLLALLYLFLIIFPPIALWERIDMFLGYPVDYSTFWMITLFIMWMPGLVLISNYSFINFFKRDTNLKRDVFIALAMTLLFVGIKTGTAYLIQKNDYKQLSESTDYSDYKEYLKNCPNGFFAPQIFASYDSLFFDYLKKEAELIYRQKNRYNYETFASYKTEFGTKGSYLDSALTYQEKYHFKEVDRAKTLKEILLFEREYPNSKYLAQIQEIRLDIWDDMIAKYDEVISRKRVSKQASETFKNTLLYLRNTNQNTIYVSFERNLAIKDIEQYSKNVLRELDFNYLVIKELKPKEGYDRYTEPSNSTIYSIREHFPESTDEYEYSIVNGLKETFTGIFENDFLIFKKAATHKKDSNVTIVISYNIQNFELNNVPSLIPYSQTDEFNNFVKFNGWVIDIETSFEYSMYLPNQKRPYEPNALKTTPEGKPYEVKSVKDAYEQLIKSSFGNYANIIIKHFGVQNDDKAAM